MHLNEARHVMCSADRPCSDAGDCIHISSELQVQTNGQPGMLMADPFCGTKTPAMYSVGLSIEIFFLCVIYSIE